MQLKRRVLDCAWVLVCPGGRFVPASMIRGADVLVQAHSWGWVRGADVLVQARSCGWVRAADVLV